MGRCNRAVGGVVWIVSVSVVDCVVEVFIVPGLNMQFDSVGSPEHVYVTGRAVCCPDPLEITNEGVLELCTVMLTAPVTCPCATLSVPFAEGEFN